MEGQASISSDILARYAADAACEVEGVHAARKVKVGADRIELRLTVDWGFSIPAVAREVQARVGEYLVRMADLEQDVDVVVDRVA
jgi:uncharacterized alkaline shock family protein YloU